MKYHFKEIEDKWQQYWSKNETFKAEDQSARPKYYVLDMFPYPSGAGLHVGHPLGYIASDIYARYKRHKGFNVLHPMGYDSFGLPAEQFAIQTGKHPALTTETNIRRYREQLDNIGFSFDWSREVRTSDPEYYKWTQWIFIQLFDSWYDKNADRARPVSELESLFASEGNSGVNAACDEDIKIVTSTEWNAFSEKEKQEVLLQYRLAYLAETEVNWCPELGTVLANDEIVNGLSERGGYPVLRKKMTQWSMRISAYAERLLQGLEKIDWSESIKETQRNWIGKSVGAMVTFKVKGSEATISVFTTRPDTIFGVSFMTLAPEHELVQKITTPSQKQEVEAYLQVTAKRSERERMADVKTISGVFTGAYAEHPFTKEPIPVWIGDYVLAGYGTGAVMAVPCGDQRDHDFARHFGIPIPNVFKDVDISEQAHTEKEGTVITNSRFLNDLSYKKAVRAAIFELENIGQGKGRTNYRLRDAVFSRQRYWGEPFPVYYKDGSPQMIDIKYLPLQLPEVEKYLPTEDGQPPLGRASFWAWDTMENKITANEKIDHKTVYPLELNTMPGWAGSSWYFFRYMDPQNKEAFASASTMNYWENVDLYIGGSEHATGHLLYSRFWVKFLYDRGFVPVEEPFKKLINQGMILGESAFIHAMVLSVEKEGEPIYRSSKTIFISKGIYDTYEDFIGNEYLEKNKDLKNILYRLIPSEYTSLIEKGEAEPAVLFLKLKHVEVSLLKDTSNALLLDAFLNHPMNREYQEAIFVMENGHIYDASFSVEAEGEFIVSREVEKMSKSKLNVVNPDDICEQYGADTLRMYEMFLGPIEQAKPWNTAGITGVHSFLKKLWKLYVGDQELLVTEEPASRESLKTLHKTIKKVEEDVENFSFNTSVSTFMIAVNELTSQKCQSKEVLEPLLVLLSPFAPHIAEELWNRLGHTESISRAPFPVFEEKYLVESSKEYPVSFNGKVRFTLELPLDLSKEEIEKTVMAHEKTTRYLEGNMPKKVIVVPGKIINIVV